MKETVVELSSGFGSLLRQRDRLQKSIPTQMQSLKGAIASEEGVRQKERSPYQVLVMDREAWRSQSQTRLSTSQPRFRVLSLGLPADPRLLGKPAHKNKLKMD